MITEIKAYFHNRHRIGDATVAIAIVVLAFILPSKPRFWCFGKPGEGTIFQRFFKKKVSDKFEFTILFSSESRPSPALLDWRYVQQKFPWSVLLLLGGGYAISDASKESGLSLWLGSYLSSLAALPPFAVMILMCMIASAMTEIASNTAVTSILLPIVAQIVRIIKIIASVWYHPCHPTAFL